MAKANYKTIEDYLNDLEINRREHVEAIRNTILQNLPAGFEEGIQYGMIGYFVPHSIYPAGYHVNPKEPLPFLGLAAQKNSINLYHFGLYVNNELMNWYLGEYPKFIKTRPDMGKSCLRFKKIDQPTLELIGQLVQKVSVEEFIVSYETIYKKTTS
ncbi:MAG: DUF1801 domain-containing protein [Bacteroidales bacterium]|nr:DUF1801 domain-containing protein [Bacteroidales bacterium]